MLFLHWQCVWEHFHAVKCSHLPCVDYWKWCRCNSHWLMMSVFHVHSVVTEYCIVGIVLSHLWSLWILSTGENPSEDLGTKSCFGMPDKIQRSPSAKAVWKVELEKGSNPPTGSLNLTITPPADTPIGKYNLTARHRDEETLLAELVVLFNPWCPGKLSFYLPTCFPGSPALFICCCCFP